MDLSQRKLSKTEWIGIEVPISTEEISILKLITEGYNNIQYKRNNTLSLLGYLKVGESQAKIMHDFIYCQYIKNIVDRLCKLYNFDNINIKNPEKKIKKADLFRIQNTNRQLEKQKSELYEYVILNLVEKMLHERKREKKWITYYYTINMLLTYNIQKFNKPLYNFISMALNKLKDEVRISHIIQNGYELIEKNDYLLKYADEQLYDHQKELFTLCKNSSPKLILYIAPTGTGKTMSPIGLSEERKIIFVCAARHVGLALAKAAISMHKKVAFAFGCSDATDIRLHYFSAKEYTRNKRSGAIQRVDNSVGDKVEIMICDIKSYIPAMYYMRSFNSLDSLITYWDEPTITMDYDQHEFHAIIQNNWKENIIPTVVLSSATLPQQDEIIDTIMDFRSKFDGANVYNVVSYDCKKTIPLINKEGFAEMPHYMFEQYSDILKTIDHCKKFKTLLRYLDLSEVIDFVAYINKHRILKNNRYYMEEFFTSIDQVNMKDLKLYYLDVLKNIEANMWPGVYNHFQKCRKKRYNSNIQITTKDAYTLTDGPTIFLADDIEKIAQFCIQTSNIPDRVLLDISDIIAKNNVLNTKIAEYEKKLEDGTNKDEGKERKMADGRIDPEMRRLMKTIEDLRSMVKPVALNDIFVPNRQAHLRVWAPSYMGSKRTFTCTISDSMVERIMLIHDIEDSWKLLLMMGIGVFANHDSIAYTEIMKELAYNEKLYLIIASSDFVYGTNYQFCHGYISKDLGLMSQEKCIQAMGRVGRNKLQHDYSLRFRENDLLIKLFTTDSNKPEVRNMNRLFKS